MEDLNNFEGVVSHDEVTSQKEVRKRISWVAKEHKAMVNFVEVIYRNLGHADYHSNKAIARELNFSPDSIKYQLTSCQQYKLLEIKFGVGYKITDLFKKIYHPLNDNEKREAIIESLTSPETYVQLFKEYAEHVLPQTIGLKNHFVRNFHLEEKNAEKAAEVFINNLKEYNLLDVRGVLVTGTQKIQDAEVVSTVSNNINTEAKQFPVKVPRQEIIEDHLFTGDSNKKIPIFLTQKKVAYLVYPDEVTVNDIKIIEHQVAGILLRLQLENEENNKGA